MSRQRFSEQWINGLLEHVDIVQVITDAGIELTKHTVRGEFVTLCPFHSEKNPSFTVVPRKQLYHCFGCGAGGTAIEFLMEYNHWHFTRAVVYLAKMAEYPLSQSKKKRKKRAWT